MTAVLAYHKVDRRFEVGLTGVKPRTFKRQIDSILAHGYRAITDIVPSGSGRTVCLTFDDGYDCFYRNVIPALNSVKAKAIVFVISDFIGKTNSWDIRLSRRPFFHMDAAQIREASDAGFEIGSHSCSHRDLTRLEERLMKEELKKSKEVIEEMIGREVDAFAFPFGRYNRAAAEAAFETGYRRIFGLGSASSEGVIPRIPVYRIDTASAVLRKLEFSRIEIKKSDFIHSFANISAILSVRGSREKR